MQRRDIVTARAVAWDDDSVDWSSVDGAGQFSVTGKRQSWLTRQLIAAVWIMLAWAVGTLVFELGALG